MQVRVLPKSFARFPGPAARLANCRLRNRKLYASSNLIPPLGLEPGPLGDKPDTPTRSVVFPRATRVRVPAAGCHCSTPIDVAIHNSRLRRLGFGREAQQLPNRDFNLVRTAEIYSATGSRIPVAQVRAEYPDQLDYSGRTQHLLNPASAPSSRRACPLAHEPPGP